MTSGASFIRVTITVDLEEGLWGAVECLEESGSEALLEMLHDNAFDLLDEGELKFERINK